MAQRTSKTSKNSSGGIATTIQKQSSTKQGRQSQQTEKRLNAVFDALTEELLENLEHYYDRKEN